VNNIITHGIPDESVLIPSFCIFEALMSCSRPLEDGDIVNVDITVYHEGYHGDTSKTFLVGEVVRQLSNILVVYPFTSREDEAGRQLVEVTNRALELGIMTCAPGKHFKDIGRSIHQHVRNQAPDFCISTQFTGHGIGTVFHRPPWILHYCELQVTIILLSLRMLWHSK
jgi:methionyl aminopeptidase